MRDGDAMDPIQTQRLAPVEGNAASNMTSSSLFGESKVRAAPVHAHVYANCTAPQADILNPKLHGAAGRHSKP